MNEGNESYPTAALLQQIVTAAVAWLPNSSSRACPVAFAGKLASGPMPVAGPDSALWPMAMGCFSNCGNGLLPGRISQCHATIVLKRYIVVTSLAFAVQS
jgi:hypothetical protein